jgi:hypothetical protein
LDLADIIKRILYYFGCKKKRNFESIELFKRGQDVKMELFKAFEHTLATSDFSDVN